MLIVNGDSDPMATPEQTSRLTEQLRRRGADVELLKLPTAYRSPRAGYFPAAATETVMEKLRKALDAGWDLAELRAQRLTRRGRSAKCRGIDSERRRVLEDMIRG